MCVGGLVMAGLESGDKCFLSDDGDSLQIFSE
jgi:hypothetical protein